MADPNDPSRPKLSQDVVELMKLQRSIATTQEKRRARTIQFLLLLEVIESCPPTDYPRCYGERYLITCGEGFCAAAFHIKEYGHTYKWKSQTLTSDAAIQLGMSFFISVLRNFCTVDQKLNKVTRQKMATWYSKCGNAPIAEEMFLDLLKENPNDLHALGGLIDHYLRTKEGTKLTPIIAGLSVANCDDTYFLDAVEAACEFLGASFDSQKLAAQNRLAMLLFKQNGPQKKR